MSENGYVFASASFAGIGECAIMLVPGGEFDPSSPSTSYPKIPNKCDPFVNPEPASPQCAAFATTTSRQVPVSGQPSPSSMNSTPIIDCSEGLQVFCRHRTVFKHLLVVGSVAVVL